MARVTIEDSLAQCDNVYELIRIAAKRAYQLEKGAEPKVPVNGDKSTVIALREIAAGHIDFSKEVIPEDVWHTGTHGPEVNRPRTWGTGSTQYTAGDKAK